MAAKIEKPGASPPPLRVLLIDDEPSFAQMMGAIFAHERDLAIAHVWAPSLKEGVARLAGEAFDLVLLDLMLGDSRGLDTVRRVREATARTPIIVLTGMSSRQLGRDAIRLGAQDYQVKGGDPVSIIRGICNVIERDRIQRQLQEAQHSLRAFESALIQAEKMESVGRLAAGVAHEVKNPLAIIQMGVDALRRVPGNQAELPASVLQDMAAAVDRARNIINGLLNFSRPAEAASTPVDLSALLDEAVQMAAHELQKKEIRVVRSFAPAVPPLLLDRASVLQVFINLLVNAAQAMSAGGELRLSITTTRFEKVGNGVGRRTSDTFRVGQQVVTASVKDSGPGIPPDALPKIFDPFFTTKRQGEGTGLGLYVCRSIVNLHGGRITAENAPDGGAVMTVTFIA